MAARGFLSYLDEGVLDEVRLKGLILLLNEVCDSPFRLLRFHLHVFGIPLLFLLTLTAVVLLGLFGKMTHNGNIKSEGDIYASGNLEAINSTTAIFIFCS